MRDPERAESIYSTSETPSLDQVFEVLSDRTRRYALYCLRDAPDGVAPVSDVVAFVCEHETDAANGDTELHRSVRTTLQHVHLPKLADAGFIEYDERSEMIRYWGQPSLDEWLEHAYHKEL